MYTLKIMIYHYNSFIGFKIPNSEYRLPLPSTYSNYSDDSFIRPIEILGKNNVTLTKPLSLSA